MEYISERIINAAELETLVRAAYYDIAALREEIERESPSMEKVDELSKQLHMRLLQAKDFEFCVERRRTFSKGEFRSQFPEGNH